MLRSEAEPDDSYEFKIITASLPPLAASNNLRMYLEVAFGLRI